MKEKTPKLFKEKNLTITNNIIETGTHFIQISNITLVWKGTIPKKSLPIILVLVLFVLGVSSFSVMKYLEIFSLLGIIFIGSCGWIIYENLKQKIKY